MPAFLRGMSGGSSRPTSKSKVSGSGRPGKAKRSLALASQADPLAIVTAPPAKESSAERDARLQEESVARKRSEDIDKWLKADSTATRKDRQGEVQLALLGQSGAGKTTLLKQMRLLYDPQGYERERTSWRLVIYLNVITATRLLLEGVERVLEEQEDAKEAATRAAIRSGAVDVEETIGDDSVDTSSSGGRRGDFVPTGLLSAAATAVNGTSHVLFPTSSRNSLISLSRQDTSSNSTGRRSSSQRGRGPCRATLLIRLRLAPLLSLEPDLRNRLGAVGDDVANVPEYLQAKGKELRSSLRGSIRTKQQLPNWRGGNAGESASNGVRLRASAGIKVDVDESSSKDMGPRTIHYKPKRSDDLVLKAGWQDRSAEPPSPSAGSPPSSPTSPGYPPPSASLAFDMRTSLDSLQCEHNNEVANRLRQREEDGPQALVLACKGDIQALWSGKDSGVFSHGSVVKKLRQNFTFERVSAPTWFLDQLDRISVADYAPTNEDIMHARVRTIGLSESVFQVGSLHKYRVYDVGGDRSQRIAWAPFLGDQVRAVIFMAPVGAYDQRLQEDASVNRVQDSLDLFWQVATSPLLLSASVVLLLNKIDLLQHKVRRGVSVKKHWPNYDGRDDDYEQVWRWFRARFTDVAKASRGKLHSELQRNVGQVYIFPSCAVDTSKIKAILISVQDTILRSNLQEAGLY
ncbi:G-alpha-domain-containing protein [Tilletiaria anomala UBC 951]|uniref:G-alpha-domain-containing protein n=1 Tax=Tilletiaria anomala (strain ATCC 24038 / CBS 436.72 / UBC 951) TaxID=1037660 RepID=A0A066VXY9_TILAU|nr:G-alpha-domain-containing protein [Tilletiaria anomala UBC 951]KDN43689.1 G-alpha-domain-containing protein [Tilletiaria anomala UBC 951]